MSKNYDSVHALKYSRCPTARGFIMYRASSGEGCHCILTLLGCKLTDAIGEFRDVIVHLRVLQYTQLICFDR
jgi:hypothetical protein